MYARVPADVGVKRDRPDAKKVKVVPKFVWSDDDTAQFERLKATVLSAPMLAYLDYSRPIFIRCDASRLGLTNALMNLSNARWLHDTASQVKLMMSLVQKKWTAKCSKLYPKSLTQQCLATRFIRSFKLFPTSTLVIPFILTPPSSQTL